VASMPQPAPRLDDDGLVAEILARVPEAGDERRVRSLLAAWWRYAGVRNAAGAVVDSETFIAERGALGLLELPPTVAARVIALEFALLHDPAAVVESEPAPPPEPPAPIASEPAPLRVIPSLDLSRPVEGEDEGHGSHYKIGCRMLDVRCWLEPAGRSTPVLTDIRHPTSEILLRL